MTPELMALGYRATQTDTELVIHRVPIFCACERGEVKFDDKWIAAAVAKAKQSEREGYYPPLHIRHHEAATEATNAVRAAGFFKITGTSSITFKGARKTAVFADLVITDPGAQHEVLSKRLPYRSVEIFNVEKPALDGLALLDHEAPFLELPMLMVSEIVDKTTPEEPGPSGNIPGATSGLVRVANATFRRSWSMDASQTDSPMVACFRRGDAAHLLFDEDQTMTEAELAALKAAEAENAATNFGGDGPPKPEHQAGGDDEGKDENMEGEGDEGESGGSAKLDVDAIVKAIESGEIAVKDMDAINAAIQAQNTEVEEEEVEAPVANMPAPAASPGAEAMSKGMSAEFAALKGQHEAVMADVETMKAATKRDNEVAAALKRLEGRPLGADLEQRLVAFHKDHPAAFDAYVEGMAKTTGILPGDNGSGDRFAGQSAQVPEVAMKYQTQGADAIEKAAHFSSIWSELHGAGMTRLSEERYVEINMSKAAAAV